MNNKGFTLIELMIVIAIMGTLAGIAVPSYSKYIERTKNFTTVSELKLIDQELQLYFIDNETYPSSLADIGLDGMLDPWGNPYEYLALGGGGTIGKARKDHFLVPVNTDYDLYSKGPDGKSVAPFTAKHSRDDIVRANDGQFFGPVSAY